MTRLQVQHIDPNDFDSWEDFLKYQSPNTDDDDSWFTITVGVEGEEGGNNFQVHVATPKAIGRIKQDVGRFKDLIVEEFTPQNIETVIRDAVDRASGLTWNDGVNRLRKLMFWEYEGM